MVVEDGRPASLPLMPERAEDLAALYAVDKRQLFPVTFYDEPGHPRLGHPETFMVTPSGRSADLPLPSPRPAGADWIEAYHYWLGRR